VATVLKHKIYFHISKP